jgi:hypothetical protein
MHLNLDNFASVTMWSWNSQKWEEENLIVFLNKNKKPEWWKGNHKINHYGQASFHRTSRQNLLKLAEFLNPNILLYVLVSNITKHYVHVDITVIGLAII